MKDSLKEYLTELRERAEMDEKLTQEERDAELQKLKSLQDTTKFDPNAREDEEDEAKAAEAKTDSAERKDDNEDKK